MLVMIVFHHAPSSSIILSEQVLEYLFLRSRRWSRGAVIRNLGKNGLAEQAGCKAGDIIVTWNPWMDTLMWTLLW